MPFLHKKKLYTYILNSIKYSALFAVFVSLYFCTSPHYTHMQYMYVYFSSHYLMSFWLWAKTLARLN